MSEVDVKRDMARIREIMLLLLVCASVHVIIHRVVELFVRVPVAQMHMLLCVCVLFSRFESGKLSSCSND